MEKDGMDLHEIETDLRRIKEAISKSDGFFSLIDTGGAVRSALLAGGLLIAGFAAGLYWLIERCGSFADIPAGTRIALFALLGLAWSGVGFLKVRNFLQSARKISSDMTVYKLFEEIYKPRFLALLLPHVATMALVIVFLANRGHGLYIIPSLAVLYGLLTISLCNVFFLKEFFLLGAWLTATGLLSLFAAEIIHPLAVLGFTFAAGFILAALLLYLGQPGVKR